MLKFKSIKFDKYFSYMTGTGFRRGTRRGGVKKQNGTNTRRGGDIFY